MRRTARRENGRRKNRAVRAPAPINGKNIAFEYRTTEGKAGRNPDLVADLVHLKVDIIVVGGSGAAWAAKKATSTIPIVMISSTDPGRDRTRCQPSSAWRKRHETDISYRRIGWKTFRATKGSRS